MEDKTDITQVAKEVKNCERKLEDVKTKTPTKSDYVKAADLLSKEVKKAYAKNAACEAKRIMSMYEYAGIFRKIVELRDELASCLGKELSQEYDPEIEKFKTIIDVLDRYLMSE